MALKNSARGATANAVTAPRIIEQLPGRLNHSNNASRLRLQYLAEQLHALGPAPLFYFLAEIEGGAELRPHLERYARLPAEFIAAYAGDKLPERLLAIEGGRH